MLTGNRQVIYKGEEIAKMDTTVTKLTEEQKADLGAMTEFKEKASPEGKKKKMEKSLNSVRGSYGGFYEYQSERSVYGVVNYLYYGAWDIFIFMFLGMALYKNGVLLGRASAKVYWILFIAGLGLGLTLSYFRLQPLIDYKFNYFDYTKNTSFEFYELSRTFRAIGIFGLIMLLI